MFVADVKNAPTQLLFRLKKVPKPHTDYTHGLLFVCMYICRLALFRY